MGKGLSNMLKSLGAINVSSEGKTVLWVWDYANDKARIKSEMTKDEISASEKAKWMNFNQKL